MFSVSHPVKSENLDLVLAPHKMAYCIASVLHLAFALEQTPCRLAGRSARATSLSKFRGSLDGGLGP